MSRFFTRADDAAQDRTGYRSAQEEGAARREASRAADPGASAPPTQLLIDAGIKALGSAGDDMVSRQGRVFEAILGVNPAQAWVEPVQQAAKIAEAAPDPFGFRKFEDIFDQRVARALERLGVPSADDVRALRDEVQALRKALQNAGVTPPKPRRG